MIFRISLLLVCLSAVAADRWNGVAAGPNGVGFRFKRSVDPTRTISGGLRGTPLGLAIWYPGSQPPKGSQPVSQLDYQLLQFSVTVDAQARLEHLDSEASAMVAWRHIGIVPLTLDQARTAINSGGRATRDAVPAPGRFPVVIITGGAFYLATTAEILASHGYLVVAPVRFADLPYEVPTLDFTWNVENAVRDAEWALAEISHNAAADMTRVTAVGHGGGGMQAVLLAMRNRGIHAVANIDSGNFSSRTNMRQFTFYSPRLLRVPYLNIMSASTRRDSDQYSDFEGMHFSRRYEVVLENPLLRHHDLSDIGRPVSAVLAIRGEAQTAVLHTYADVQQMLVRFLASSSMRETAPDQFEGWLRQSGGTGDYAVSVRSAVAPAPTARELTQRLDDQTIVRLAQARERDPDAPLFSEDQMQTIVREARRRDPALAADLGRFALVVHPKSLPVHQLASESFELKGDRTAALEVAERCVALDLPRNDWRSQAALNECQRRVQRLRTTQN